MQTEDMTPELTIKLAQKANQVVKLDVSEKSDNVRTVAKAKAYNTDAK
jgi:hypothetical protein